MENKTETTPTSEQVYAKYCIQAKANIQRISLEKKQKFFSNLLFSLWSIIMLFTLFLYLFMSGFNLCAFKELTTSSVGICTFFGAVSLGLLMILITKNIKPDPIKFTDICKKADKLIEEKKKRLTQEHSRNKQELELFNEFF